MDLPDRHAEAITHLEAAVRMRPENTEAQVNLGVALADIPARSQEAIAHLEVALAKRPDLPVRELLERLRADGQATARLGTPITRRSKDQKIGRSQQPWQHLSPGIPIWMVQSPQSSSEHILRLPV